MVLLAIWQITLAAPSGVDTLPRNLAGDLGTAPTIAPMEWVGIPLRTPDEAQCQVGDEVLPAGLWLNDAQAKVVHERLLTLDSYPARCQARLDAKEIMCRAREQAAVDVARADFVADKVARETMDPGWRWWHVALAGLGGAALGASIGGGFALMVRQ